MKNVLYLPLFSTASRVYHFAMKQTPLLEALMAEKRSFLVLFFILSLGIRPFDGFSVAEAACCRKGYIQTFCLDGTKESLSHSLARSEVLNIISDALFVFPTVIIISVFLSV